MTIRADGIAPLERFPLTVASGSANGAGNNVILTPGSGKRLRLHYVSYNPDDAVEAAFCFDSGASFLRNHLGVGGSVIAKDFGDLRYCEGPIDESLNLHLSAAVTTIWNVMYVEV